MLYLQYYPHWTEKRLEIGELGFLELVDPDRCGWAGEGFVPSMAESIEGFAEIAH